MQNRFEPLRLKRLKHRIKRLEVADKIECSPGWISRLETDPYSGPAAAKWEARYVEALDLIIRERKEMSR